MCRFRSVCLIEIYDVYEIGDLRNVVVAKFAVSEKNE